MQFLCAVTFSMFPLRFRCFLIRISSELFDGWLCPFDEVLSISCRYVCLWCIFLELFCVPLRIELLCN